jgi:hypothetical protein
MTFPDGKLIDIEDYACEELELSKEQAGDLFMPDNSREDLHEIVDSIIREEEE